jgi:PPOX class probable F420-dependent enzyme
VSFTREQQRVLSEPNFAVVATLRPDGSVHQTVMWVGADDDFVLLNTPSPVKQAHLAADPRIAVLVLSRSDPYSYLAVRGLASLDAGVRSNTPTHSRISTADRRPSPKKQDVGASSFASGRSPSARTRHREGVS